MIVEATGELSKKITDAPGTSEAALWKTLQKTIKKVEEDIEALHFNTAISQMMIFVNEATSVPKLPKETLKIFLRILCPFAPHITEELWERLGESKFLVQTDWPTYDSKLCVDDTITVVVMLNGKKRAEFEVEKGASKDQLEKLARECPKVFTAIEGKTIKRTIVVPGKLVNFVI